MMHNTNPAHPIYMDYNATTPMFPEVMEVIAAAHERYWGNPSSGHTIGCEARKQVESSRQTIADIFEISPKEIVFTSGGTESNNAAIFGILEKYDKGDVIISAIEHPSIKKAVQSYIPKGFNLLTCDVDSSGVISLRHLESLITEKTRLVSIMFANHEIGTLEPTFAIGELCKQNHVPFHCDAVQAFGKAPLDIKKNNISLLSISSHKAYGPKGVGLLFVDEGVTLAPLLKGGDQERGLRSGTPNTAAIMGMAKAMLLAHGRMSEQKRILKLSEKLYSIISGKIPTAFRNGHETHRTAGTLNICIPGLPAEALVVELDKKGICASAGAACHAYSSDPSEILMALGRRKTEALCSIRFSLGLLTTDAEIDQAAQTVCDIAASFGITESK
jgi:cysteine desulfurase